MTPGRDGRADGGTVTWRQLWAETEQLLGDRAAARWLCETAGSFEPDELLAALDEPVTERMVAHLDAMVARHRAGEPLQYALGRWGFRRLDLMVDRRVLIPRPETELVVEVALGLVRPGAGDLVVADLGTGSGSIGLALATELPVTGTTVWLTDVSEDALDVARANAAGIGRAAANVRLAAGSWWDALPAELRGSLDLVVANPPYIAEDDPEVDPSVHEWEPHVALYAGTDGLDALREIVAGAPDWLRPGGWLVLEIGHRQGDAVRGLCDTAGLVDAQVLPDLAGRQRIVVARRPAG